MFGRLIALARGWPRSKQVHARLLPMSPRCLARWLPQLGGVLCLFPCDAGVPCEPAAGLLVEEDGLAVLHRSRWLRLASAVTADGPREWADVLDACGRVCTRVYLLPGTDYCAWDAMPCGIARPDEAPAATVGFQASSVQLLRFRHRQLAGLDLLGAERCLVSPLDRRVAGEIVCREAGALPARQALD
ncbi:hypothetical protein [Frateuria sp.]|uniref:hypothetical protein n=1 Tax=Frateuria sp. TaxID=2211372 RepID=UPI0018035CC9|nr:hypothetical protein [Frateuria sp.]NUR23331.1 hypothetical protein [Frateuria sp.]